MAKVAKPRKHGNGYQVNWTDGAGKRRFETLPSDAAVAELLRALQAEADQVCSGAVDRVFSIGRFLSNKATDLLVPARKARPEVDAVCVADGYGPASIKRAMEGVAGPGAAA